MSSLQRAFDFIRGPTVPPPGASSVDVDGRRVPIVFQKNARARRYRLYVDRSGRPRVTIPRRGTHREAQLFVEKHRDWLEGQLRRASERRQQRSTWVAGTEIFYRGERQALKLEALDGTSGRIWIGTERAWAVPRLPEPSENLQPWVEARLRQLASIELPERLIALAGIHGCAVKRVTIRNQKSRWGSCSARATVSLNWRLVQVPPAVRDYVLIHELMHLREMNHSRRFWKQVAVACPEFEAHERWLREHEKLILG